MPCRGLAGTEYIDMVVRQFYGGRYSELLLDFVNDRNNKWCPKWIRRNYEIQNKEREEPSTAPASITLTKPANEGNDEKQRDEKQLENGDATLAIKDNAFPHAEKFKSSFIFEPSGEPPVGEDTERPEEYTTDHHWEKAQRPSWQRHSEHGARTEGRGEAAAHVRGTRESHGATRREGVRPALDAPELRPGARARRVAAAARRRHGSLQ